MRTSPFPLKRMRRMRNETFLRNMFQEYQLNSADFVLPVFIIDDPSKSEPISALPGHHRLGRDPLLKVAEMCQELKIPAMALFPVIPKELKTNDAKEAFNPEGLIPRRIKLLKKNFPNLGIITDVALDPYTSHGHDGILSENGHILNDDTVNVLKRQALCHAEAGADIVAPSDMMDGRIKVIREYLDQRHYIHTCILAYAAKYASSFYGPFREAVKAESNGVYLDKSTYQLNPSNAAEALHEVAMDIEEGADMIMIKPGLPYLDIIYRVKEKFQMPTLGYQVSGEYAMLKAAAQNGWINEEKCVLESLVGFKRAGCNAIFTYYALEAAQWLQKYP